jgi:hypothetical protein
MNSYVSIADLSKYEIYLFNTTWLQGEIYICHIDKKCFLQSMKEGFKQGFNGPLVMVLETPFFSGTYSSLWPLEIMEIHGMGFDSLFGSILVTFISFQCEQCGIDIYF